MRIQSKIGHHRVILERIVQIVKRVLINNALAKFTPNVFSTTATDPRAEQPPELGPSYAESLQIGGLSQAEPAKNLESPAV